MTTYDPIRSDRFVVGDRVCTTPEMKEMPLGSVGTIVTVFIVGDLYDVHFERYAEPRVVHQSEITLALPLPD